VLDVMERLSHQSSKTGGVIGHTSVTVKPGLWNAPSPRPITQAHTAPVELPLAML